MAGKTVNNEIVPWLLRELGQYCRPPRTRQPKPVKPTPALRGRGQLSPFAGLPPTREQAAAELARRRSFEGAASVVCRRGASLPASAGDSKRKKKTGK